jgi:hypothetical protein
LNAEITPALKVPRRQERDEKRARRQRDDPDSLFLDELHATSFE